MEADVERDTGGTFLEDELDLAELGHAQKYKRKFTLISAIGFTVCTTGTWEGIIASLNTSLKAGGTQNLIWGYTLVAFGMVLVSCSVSEFASIYPTNAGQYHWSSELSPPRFKIFFSWITGWISVVTLSIAIAAAAFGVAVQAQSYAVLCNAEYDPKRWHAAIIYWVVVAIAFFANVYGLRAFDYITRFIIAVHIIGYIIIVVAMMATAPRFNSAKKAFTETINITGWSDGIAWNTGLLTPSFGFIGIETAVHFSEEIKGAAKNLPKAVFYPCIINGIMVFPFLICFCFVITDLETLLTSPIGYTSPATAIFYMCTKNSGAAIFMNCLSTVVAFFSCFFVLGSLARIVSALARDKALPAQLCSLNAKLEIPFNALCVSTVFPMLIGLVYIWNETAFYGIMAGVVVAYQVTYLIPIGLALFYARRKGLLNRGHWRLGSWGYLINAICFIYLIYIIVFLAFPTVYPVTAANMNYSIVLVGFGLFCSAIVYVLYGSKHYEGPTNEVMSKESIQMKHFGGPILLGNTETSVSAPMERRISL